MADIMIINDDSTTAAFININNINGISSHCSGVVSRLLFSSTPRGDGNQFGLEGEPSPSQHLHHHGGPFMYLMCSLPPPPFLHLCLKG